MGALVCCAVIALQSPPTCVRLSHDGTHIYGAHSNGTVLTWRVPALPALPLVSHANERELAAHEPLAIADAPECAVTLRKPSNRVALAHVLCIRQVSGGVAVLLQHATIVILGDDETNFNATTTTTTNTSIERSQLTAAAAARTQLREWRVDALPSDSTFDVSPDGRCIVVGEWCVHVWCARSLL
jgi:hypothetical protein